MRKKRTSKTQFGLRKLRRALVLIGIPSYSLNVEFTLGIPRCRDLFSVSVSHRKLQRTKCQRKTEIGIDVVFH